MFERAVDYYRRLNKPSKPEESQPFRVAVLLTVLISAFAAIYYGSLGPAVGVPVIAGILIGSYFSYRRRGRDNLVVKLLITVLLLIVFGLFWSELTGSLNDLRYPLVRLFLWLQVLHSFDLPARRDLDFSLLSSTILIAFAGSLSINTSFIFVLLPFFASALAALYLGHRSSLRSSAKFVPSEKGGPWKAIAVACLVLVPLTVAFFVVLPRLPGLSSNYLPMSSITNLAKSFEGLIKNPAYRNLPDQFPDTPLPFNRDAYQGFSRFLDLRMRGTPSDTVVMKVRSNQPAYWRATAFDYYRGNGWENTEKEDDYEQIYANNLPLTVTYPAEPARYMTQELVQTFFIQQRLPNTLFAAYLPRDVFFPTKVLKVDSMMSVVTPVYLERSLIYTVISETSMATPEMLRQTTGRYPMPSSLEEKYTQLPSMSPRVKGLAQKITEGLTNDYDRVTALSDYLQRTYPYDLDVARQDNSENTVEFFLFKAKRGFCEHFATALAVMCRSINIPARLVTGYDSGEMNPLTGYYEVKARDAHAWVEVYFPMFGWIEFDPTPGWGDPSAAAQGDRTWAGFSLFQYIGRGLSRLIPSGWASALRGALRSVGAAFTATAEWIADNWQAVVPAILVALLLAAGFLLLRRKKKRAGREPPGPAEIAVYFFDRLINALVKAGVAVKASMTPLELAAEARRSLGIGSPARAAELFNSARYAPGEPGAEELDELEKAVDEAVEETAGALKPRKRFR